MTGDLVSFLRERLDEDERRALAFRTEWRSWSTTGGWSETGPTMVVAGDQVIVEDDTDWAAEIVEHVARHDPARVLREVEAKRALVELCGGPVMIDVSEIGEAPGTSLIPGAPWSAPWVPHVLRLLALPYSDHPDFDPSWAVTQSSAGS